MNRYHASSNTVIQQHEINAALNASVPENADLSEQGYFSLIDDDQPPITQFQTAELSTPFLDGTQWRRSWVVTDRPIADVREEMSCTKLQAKLALVRFGLAQAFIDFRASLALDPVANFEALAFIDDAQTWRRLDPTFNAAADAMGKTEEEKDAFFALAVTL